MIPFECKYLTEDNICINDDTIKQGSVDHNTLLSKVFNPKQELPASLMMHIVLLCSGSEVVDLIDRIDPHRHISPVRYIAHYCFHILLRCALHWDDQVDT